MKPDEVTPSIYLECGAKRGRKSPALRVVEQAQKRALTESIVATIESERVEFGKDDTGKKTFVAIFPRKEKEPYSIDISYMLDFPGLKDMFSSWFLIWGRVNAQVTRQNCSYLLRSHWFRYLKQSGFFLITVSEIDEQFLIGFNQWLHGRSNLNETGLQEKQSFHPNTIRKALGALRWLFAVSPQMRYLAERMPVGPRGAARKTNPTEVLTQAQLAAVWVAAEKETLAIRDRWKRRQLLLEQGRKALAVGEGLVVGPYKPTAKSDTNLAICLAILENTYPKLIPNLKDIKKNHRLLGDTVDHAFTLPVISSYFYPSPRDLVPLVLLISLATAFNPETVLKLTWKNIDRNVDRLSASCVAFYLSEKHDDESNQFAESSPAEPLLKVKGDKPRAKRQLLRLLDPTAADPSQASLNVVFDLLSDMTAKIRPFVAQEHADRLFVFVPARGTIRIPKGFGMRSSDTAADAGWGDNLLNFVETNKLAPFTLSTLRASLLDFVQLVNGGDLEKAREAGNHSSRVITWTHYTSDLVRSLLKEATGEILLTRDRWIATRGVVDPRITEAKADKGCATPGFGCMDPFASPRFNQKAGRLCDAFGECPDCPLVICSPGNPIDVAWWEALQRAIYRSVSTMTANMWQERWAPVASANKSLIALVSPEVINKAHRYRVELPNVG